MFKLKVIKNSCYDECCTNESTRKRKYLIEAAATATKVDNL